MIERARISNRHWKLKALAQKLRVKGLSYQEIARKVPVAKSTISLWVRHVPLTKIQRRRLNEKHDFRLIGIRAIQKMFWQKRIEAFNLGVASINKINKQSRFMVGLGLYWAEGNKKNGAAITNSDPRIIKFMVNWFGEFYLIRPQSLVLELHLHSGQNEQSMKQYWSRLTRVPLVNFKKSFIKPEGSGYRKNIHHMGTVKLRVRGSGSTYLLFRILGSIAGLLRDTIKEKPQPANWMDKLPYA